MSYKKVFSLLAFLGLNTQDFVCATDKEVHSYTKGNAAIFHHVALLQELKARFNKIKGSQEDTILTYSKRKTQTEAYMSVNAERMTSLQDDKKRYKKLINQALFREKKHANTHYVLYHAHNTSLMILHDFIKLLYSYEMLEPFPKKFHFMRFKGQKNNKYAHVNEFLDDQSLFYDHFEEFKKLMISVNFSLFAGNSGECTFEYFKNNWSVDAPELKNIFSKVFDYYSLDKNYIDQLLALTSYLTSKEGNLIQIFIPKEKIDSLVYLSRAYGVPYDEMITADNHDFKNSQYPNISPILELYCKKPSTFIDINDLQGRVLFLPDMFEPKHGIKMFRYNTIAPLKLFKYEKKLKKIVMHIMDDYLLKNPQRTEPLFKLNNYIQMNNNN